MALISVPVAKSADSQYLRSLYLLIALVIPLAYMLGSRRFLNRAETGGIGAHLSAGQKRRLVREYRSTHSGEN